MAGPGDEAAGLALVTLGYIDVDPATLTGDGMTLQELITPGLPVEDRIGHVAAGLPRTGWRRVHGVAGNGEAGDSQVFAAPTSDAGGSGWAMAHLAARPDLGYRILSADPGPVAVYPGCATRRAGLSLTWPDDLVGAAGSMPQLTIRLRNATDAEWTNERGDHPYVRGWLVDADGTRMQESSSFVRSGRGEELPTLGPGETVLLPVTMAAFDYQSLGPGRYRIDAMAVSLSLRSGPGFIVMT